MSEKTEGKYSLVHVPLRLGCGYRAASPNWTAQCAQSDHFHVWLLCNVEKLRCDDGGARRNLGASPNRMTNS
jgi:hypothetical protein